MNKKSIWTNKDGLYVGFGPRAAEVNSAAAVNAGNSVFKQVSMKVTGTDLNTAAGAKELANAPVIPAGAKILRALFHVDTAFATGTSATIEVGTYTLANAVDDQDALITSANSVSTAIDTTAEEVSGTGAYVGAAPLASAVKVAAVRVTGTYTAGVGTLIVEYALPAAG
jgi:hypothetical protein